MNPITLFLAFACFLAGLGLGAMLHPFFGMPGRNLSSCGPASFKA